MAQSPPQPTAKPGATDNLPIAELRPFRVLATSGTFEPGFRGGGTVRSVAAIVDTVSEKVDLCLITRDRDLGSRNKYPELSGRWVRRGRSRVFYLDTRRIRQWLRLQRELSTTWFDLLYVNSLWDPTFTVVPIVAKKLGIIRARVILIAPRGELARGALSLKRNKKWVFWKWWGRFLQSLDVVWHASSDIEAQEIRAVFPQARVEVNMDQVSLPYEPLPASAREGCVRLVFISRISPVKNLDLVLAALRGLRKQIEFDIYGPLEDADYWSKCQSSIGRLPANVQVQYRGELAPSEVRRTFSNYDAFVLPTLGENFGHVIAESLSASCPVVCSAVTTWTSVLEGGGGAIVRDLTPVGLAKELERIVAMTPGERLRARQAAGRAYEAWRKGADGRNVLDQAYRAEWSTQQ